MPASCSVKLQEKVPEEICFHYAARMLQHLENLHFHGKILVGGEGDSLIFRSVSDMLTALRYKSR